MFIFNVITFQFIYMVGHGKLALRYGWNMEWEKKKTWLSMKYWQWHENSCLNDSGCCFQNLLLRYVHLCYFLSFFKNLYWHILVGLFFCASPRLPVAVMFTVIKRIIEIEIIRFNLNFTEYLWKKMEHNKQDCSEGYKVVCTVYFLNFLQKLHIPSVFNEN